MNYIKQIGMSIFLLIAGIAFHSPIFSDPPHDPGTLRWFAGYFGSIGTILTLVGIAGYISIIVPVLKPIVGNKDLNPARVAMTDALYFAGCVVVGNFSLFAYACLK